MGYGFYTLDVFSDRPFGGNPLAVFPDALGLTSEQMQAITRELNLSETVFVLPPQTPQGTRQVRIFTPGQEVDFAGHPTVGTGFLLMALGLVPWTGDRTTLILEEGIGPVPVVVQRSPETAALPPGDPARNLPSFSQLSAAQPPQPVPLSPALQDNPALLAPLLSLEPEDLWLETAPPLGFSCGLPFLYVSVVDRSALGRIRLNLTLWEQYLAPSATPHVYALCWDPEHPGAQIRSRMFAPALGITEDPATGSAATALAGYLAATRPQGDGTWTWVIEQGCDLGRPSLLYGEADQHQGEIAAVRVGGRSVLISEGIFRI